MASVCAVSLPEHVFHLEASSGLRCSRGPEGNRQPTSRYSPPPNGMRQRTHAKPFPCCTVLRGRLHGPSDGPRGQSPCCPPQEAAKPWTDFFFNFSTTLFWFPHSIPRDCLLNKPSSPTVMAEALLSEEPKLSQHAEQLGLSPQSSAEPIKDCKRETDVIATALEKDPSWLPCRV